MPPKAKSGFGPQEAKIAAYATPLFLLALALVLVLVNVKHSMLCQAGGESAAEAILQRQALEKRLLALEQETLQNNMLFEKFIRRLDDHYEITKGAQITEMKNEAHFAAAAISARLSEESAPPMPSFASVYEDPTSLNNAIDGAMETLDDYQYGMSKERTDEFGGGAWEGNTGSQEAKLVDDLYGWEEQKGEAGGAGGAADYTYQQKPDVSDEEAKAQCIEWKTTYTVEPGISWGSLPFDLQNKWKLYDCDKWIGAGAAAGGSSFGGLY